LEGKVKSSYEETADRQIAIGGLLSATSERLQLYSQQIQDLKIPNGTLNTISWNAFAALTVRFSAVIIAKFGILF
jgi:hypothetical protein